MLTRDDVIYLYRCILGREPESDATINWAIGHYGSFAAARHAFISSPEFQSMNKPLVYYRPEPPQQFAKSQVISVALATIVKDEERNIDRMITSVLPLIDYAVIADTGSQDKTKQRAAAACASGDIPYKIADVPFVDFAQARNAALDLVPTHIDWILMLDADEHLVPDDYHKWINLFTQTADVWLIPRYNFHDVYKHDPVSSYPDYQGRLINNCRNPPLRFYGAVHETPQQPFVPLIAPASQINAGGSSGGPHIHHTSLVNVSAERAKDKFDFYSRLAAKKL